MKYRAKLKKLLKDYPEVLQLLKAVKRVGLETEAATDKLDGYVNGDVINLLLNNTQTFSIGVSEYLETLIYLNFVDLADFDSNKRAAREKVLEISKELNQLIKEELE